MRLDVLTLHPEMVRGPLSSSILGRAQAGGQVIIGVHDIRAQATDKHRTVDDSPYGGGAGMVMRVDVVHKAIQAVTQPGAHVVLMDAAGPPFNQDRARALATRPHVILVCGHYEGIDARIGAYVDERLSIGDYVLTGGELAALVVIDAVVRLLPGVLGNPHSAVEESFSGPLLEYPHYTRPRDYEGQVVPEVLLSGNHEAIRAWREAQSKALTAAVRPDRLGLATTGKVD